MGFLAAQSALAGAAASCARRQFVCSTRLVIGADSDVHGDVGETRVLALAAGNRIVGGAALLAIAALSALVM